MGDSNLSKERREKLKNKLEILKGDFKDNEEKVLFLNDVINELTNKKYGLIWEEHSENVDILLKDNIPVFAEDKDREIICDKNLPYNFILEGDNLHSLKLLEKTHKNKIDVIYIDPPYNTENSLTYNDTRVGSEDAFKHSKWLSFMKRRLEIAQKLLTNDGLIMVSIDDNEAYQLKLLLDEIFTENNCMGIFAVIKAEGGGMAKYLVKGHDLLFVYAKNIELAQPLARDKDIRGQIKIIDNVKYWIQEDAIRENFGEYGNLYYEDIVEKKGVDYKNKIDIGIKNNEYILVKKNNGKHVIGKLRRVDEDYSKFYSVIKHLNADGVNTLKSMGLAEEFDYPKPVSLIKELIKGATFFKKHSIILDFFAGSGTTAQAVLELNEDDNKDRKFILCTNNEVSARNKLKFVQTFGYLKDFCPKKSTTENSIENKIFSYLEEKNIIFQELIDKNKSLYDSFGICQAVTYKRTKNVIEGYQSCIPMKEVLYQKTLTEKNIFNTNIFKEDIDKIINKKQYDEYDVRLRNDNKLQLLGTINKFHQFPMHKGNVKYYKTEYINKISDDLDYFIEDELMKHVIEMIQLENSISIDNDKYIVLFNDEEAENFEQNIEKYHPIKIYIDETIFLSEKTKKELEHTGCEILPIPDYYFAKDIKG